MDAGFFAPQKVNRTGLVLVVALHAAAISALALSKMEVPIRPYHGPFKLRPFTEPPVPPPNTEEAKHQASPTQKVRPTTPRPIVDLPIDSDQTIETVETDRPATLDPPVIPIVDLGPIADPAPPVRITAVIDPRAALQPPYPPSAERLGEEGVVKVRVLIGADGRVKAVEKISATSDAFWRATERHAVRNWRFRPATLDGRPVESWREMTVRFELTANA